METLPISLVYQGRYTEFKIQSNVTNAPVEYMLQFLKNDLMSIFYLSISLFHVMFILKNGLLYHIWWIYDSLKFTTLLDCQ